MKELKMSEEKMHLQRLRMECLRCATSLLVYNDNGDKELNKDNILEAAKEFFEFVK